MKNLPRLGPSCPRCATPLTFSTMCGQCLRNPPEQDATFSIFRYQSPIDRLITDLKYRDKLFLSRFFAQQMAEQANNRPLPQLLIPIPLHTKRLRHRGYNQAMELARYLSKQLSIPVRNDILIRTRDTLPQASLPFSERKKNIKRAFGVNNFNLPKHIALIDDVLTTGHTADVAAKALRQANVNTIELWTIARTIRHY
ncbi:MAG: ComF family protein [Gammaproteobacteria bacterium]|nr:MAG: ComF family protein [Gammaproteobacteria bacterium]